MRPPPGQLEYPRLVLPPAARQAVIKRAHLEVGHMGVAKTLHRIQEAYKWPKIHAEVLKWIRHCPECIVNHGRRERPLPDPMPLAEYPGQIMGMDLSGPFAPSTAGNTYILTFIDHASGFAEAIPIKNKTAQAVYDQLHRRFMPWVAPPEILVVDNGLEFAATLVDKYLKELGVDVRHICPWNAKSNGRIERFHRSLKDIIRKLTRAQPHLWEDVLGDALLAHRTTPSDVTGFSPYFLFFGRHPPQPYFRLLDRQEGLQTSRMAQRVDEVSGALKVAWRNAYINRQYNMDRLTRIANAQPLREGDAVVVMNMDGTKLDPPWDHGYLVTRVRGSVITVVGPSGQRKQLSRDKVRRVEPDVEWGDLRHRMTRGQRRTQNANQLILNENTTGRRSQRAAGAGGVGPPGGAGGGS